MRCRPFIALAVFAFPLTTARSQRPSLPRDKDPNDWGAYYDEGVDWLGKNNTRAGENFSYASHLRPDRAEPILGLWLTFWARDIGRYERYLQDDERVLRDPNVIRADSLRERAFRRNPFVHQGLIVVIWDQLPGRWRDDPLTRGWLALGQAHLPEALIRFGRLSDGDSVRYGYLRFVRASAFVNSRHLDSATSEISRLLAQLRAQDAKSLGNGYESKELLEYAMGLLLLNQQRVPAAREAFGRAVVENAAFAPAHAKLGDIAFSLNDTATALLEYALAAETDPTDVEIRIGQGKVLRQAGHMTQAIAEFKKAILLEPLYATPYFMLASALEDSSDKPGAAEAYSQFLSHATGDDPRRAQAEQKLLALKAP